MAERRVSTPRQTPSTQPSSDPRQRLGIAGEAEAENALARAGLRILARRFRCRGGEIDLVALEGDVVVFVEVKTRRGAAYGRPAAAVTARKRGHMEHAARVFLARLGASPPCRFDVVEVVPAGNGGLEAKHVRDAFRLGLWGEGAAARRWPRRPS